MTRFLTGGTVAAGLSLAALAATAVGKPQLGAFLGSGEAANAVQLVVAGVGTLVAGVLGGIRPAA